MLRWKPSRWKAVVWSARYGTLTVLGFLACAIAAIYQLYWNANWLGFLLWSAPASIFGHALEQRLEAKEKANDQD